MNTMKLSMLTLAMCASCVSLAANARNSNYANQRVDSISSSQTQSTAQNQASNAGVSATNIFQSSSDTTNHVYGVTGSNTPVGLGAFSSSFSSDYCGGTSQTGFSIPYVTFANGKPILGDPGIACVDTRASVHTMEYSATYGKAAENAGRAGNVVLANEYADISGKLAKAAVYMLCSLSESIRVSYRDAGVDCPMTKEEAQARADQQAKIAKAAQQAKPIQSSALQQKQASATVQPTQVMARTVEPVPSVPAVVYQTIDSHGNLITTKVVDRRG